MPGFYASKKENKLGMRCSDTASLTFDNVRVPASHLIGNEGEGFIQALQILDGGRISIAALSVGLAQGALNASLKYSVERKQFNQRLADMQAIQFKLAKMAMVKISHWLHHKQNCMQVKLQCVLLKKQCRFMVDMDISRNIPLKSIIVMLNCSPLVREPARFKNW
jgi:hypothetical protein